MGYINCESYIPLIQVVANHEIIDSGMVSRELFYVNFNATTAPTAKVVAIAVSDENELVVDAMVLNVDSDLPNHVRIS